MERETEEFIKDSLKINIEVKKADKMTLREDKEIVIVKIGCWEKGISSDKKKELMKGVIIIENDLTKKKRRKKLREIAKEERERKKK